MLFLVYLLSVFITAFSFFVKPKLGLTKGIRYATIVKHSWGEETYESRFLYVMHGRGGMPSEQYRSIYGKYAIQTCIVCGSVREKECVIEKSDSLRDWSDNWNKNRLSCFSSDDADTDSMDCPQRPSVQYRDDYFEIEVLPIDFSRRPMWK